MKIFCCSVVMTTLSSFFFKYRTTLILFLITLHLFLMNGFYPTHRQLTVATYFTSIRNLIDPSLYKNSIYIQAVNRSNLRISIVYDIVPFVVKHIDFELFAIIQGIISIFFITAGLYRLTFLWFGSESAGYLAALLYTPALNTWTLGSPAPYLNFFHHGLPFTYPLIIWSLVFFWQQRYVLAFLLAGCSWNFHPMCTLFLLFAYVVFWLFNLLKEFTGKLVGKCLICFLLPALPTLSRTFIYMEANNSVSKLWLKGVSWVADYTCLPSHWHSTWLLRACLFFILFFVCLYHIKDIVLRRWISIFVLAVLILCLAGTVCADIIPVQAIIKASMWRSTIIYLFIALPCLAWIIMKLCTLSKGHAFVGITLALLLTDYIPNFKFWYMPFYLLLVVYFLYVERLNPDNLPQVKKRLLVIFGVLTSGFICAKLYGKPINVPILFFIGVMVYIWFFDQLSKRMFLKKGLIQAGVFIILFDTAILYHNGGPAIYFHGKIKGKNDPWADIQKYAQTISDKDDVFIVPPHMNDFSLYSYRAVLGDWAEGSTLLYLDNRFTEEWFERMYDLGWTEKELIYDGYNRLTTDAVLRAAQKYGAKFIVTEKPKTFALKKLYENNKFILYRAEKENQFDTPVGTRYVPVYQHIVKGKT